MKNSKEDLSNIDRRIKGLSKLETVIMRVCVMCFGNSPKVGFAIPLIIDCLKSLVPIRSKT